MLWFVAMFILITEQCQGFLSGLKAKWQNYSTFILLISLSLWNRVATCNVPNENDSWPRLPSQIHLLFESAGCPELKQFQYLSSILMTEFQCKGLSSHTNLLFWETEMDGNLVCWLDMELEMICLWHWKRYLGFVKLFS